MLVLSDMRIQVWITVLLTISARLGRCIFLSSVSLSQVSESPTNPEAGLPDNIHTYPTIDLGYFVIIVR